MGVSFEDGVKYVECDTCHLEIRGNQSIESRRDGVFHKNDKCERT